VTSFHHQPEAQHPKSSAIHKLLGRLPHLFPEGGIPRSFSKYTPFDVRNQAAYLATAFVRSF
jgi:hypothetical protein